MLFAYALALISAIILADLLAASSATGVAGKGRGSLTGGVKIWSNGELLLWVMDLEVDDADPEGNCLLEKRSLSTSMPSFPALGVKGREDFGR